MKNRDEHKSLMICYFGAYSRGYSRNTVIRMGLERRGVKVVDCWAPKINAMFLYPLLVMRFLLRARGCDAILVGDGRHYDVPIARFLGAVTGKKVILDAFISHYDTWVHDRAIFSPKSRQARVVALVDKWGALLAHFVLLDTQAHINFYSQRYGIPVYRFRKVLVGADDSVFTPCKDVDDSHEEFRVLFYGTYIPLHGVQTILRAAKSLEGEKEIVFDLVGEGQTYEEDRRLSEELGLKNVNFQPSTSIEGIARYIARCHLCLGIFGTTGKAGRVIPNKVYQALAMKNPVITPDTLAARELFVHRKHVLLCPAGDPSSLASSIMELKKDIELRKHISEKGHEIFLERLLPEKIVKPIIELLE